MPTDPATLALPERLRRAEEALPSDPAQALSLAREELRQTSSPLVKARALQVIGTCAYRQGQAEEALEPLRQAGDGFAALADSAGRLEVLQTLGRAERDLGNLDAAADAFARALTLAGEIGDRVAECDALNLHAGVLHARGEHRLAFEHLERALTVAGELGLCERRANILSNLGSLHTHLGDYPQALECLKQAHALICEAAPGTRSETSHLISLGQLYIEMGNASEARAFFTRACQAGRRTGDKVVEAAALNNLANVLAGSGEWAGAREHFENALTLARQLGHRPYEIDNLDGLGQIHAALGEHELALRAHAEALAIARALGERKGELDALLNLGRDHLAAGRPAEALGPLDEALALATRLERKRPLFEAHELLARAHEQLGDFASALQHQRQFHQVERTVFNEEREAKTRQLIVQFELERTRREAEQYQLRVEAAQKAREEAEARALERTRELEEAQLDIVTRLAVAAEYRDDDTGEHTLRVGRNAAAMARVLGWPEEEVRLLFAAARLHDVGKIGIRDAILLKPGKLTPEEFDMMRAHASIGASILAGGRSRLLRMAEEIAGAHHERWDGQGYPLGLAGEAIPESARIVAVADVLDALTHVRPYKPAWSVAKALAEIRHQRGRQFDPQVVDACLRIFGQEDL